MKRPYFPVNPDDPQPLRATVERTVRFEEVDPLGIVWHGRYISYFEDARVALGEKYGIGYMDFYHSGIVAPIRKVHIDYHRPLQFQDTCTIEAILHWSDAARLNYEFIIRNAQQEVATTGYTVQMFMDKNHTVQLTLPPFFAAFRERWCLGEFQ